MVIYIITNLINGKIYIGQDSNDNPTYYGSGKAIKMAIKKYGKSNFKREILEKCLTIEELNNKEIYWISTYNSTDRKIGYNISSGGSEGDRQAGYDIAKIGIYEYWVDKYGKEEANIRLERKKEKLSKKNKEVGSVFTREGGVYQYWVDKYGKEEANIRLEKKKEKLREINRKKKEEGWHHSDESINKISKALKERIVSDQTRKKMSESRMGIRYSDETINKMILASKDRGNKPVMQLTKSGDFIKEWKSQSEVKEVLNLSIWNCLNGLNKTSGGYKWEYKNKF